MRQLWLARHSQHLKISLLLQQSSCASHSIIHSLVLQLTSSVVQTIGGALFVSAAQAAFVNTLISQLLVHAPGVDPAIVLAAGATGLRDTFTEAQLPGLLVSYMAALRVAYTISIGTGGAATVVALFSPWTSIKGKVTMG